MILHGGREWELIFPRSTDAVEFSPSRPGDKGMSFWWSGVHSFKEKRHHGLCPFKPACGSEY